MVNALFRFVTRLGCRWLSSQRRSVTIPFGIRPACSITQLGRTSFCLETSYSVQLQSRYSTATEVPATQAPSQHAEESNTDANTGRMLETRYNCSGCGAVLQSSNPKHRGFIPSEKLEEWSLLATDPNRALSEVEDVDRGEMEGGEEIEGDEDLGEIEGGETRQADDDDDSDVEDYFPESADNVESAKYNISSLVCKRCFSLKHYNSALNITLDSDDYLAHLSSLKNKTTLILLMLDVTDFPSCVFPNLNTLLSPNCSVLIVANKIDLFPRNLTNNFWNRFRDYIVSECKASSLGDHKIVGVRFVSVKRGIGTTQLSEEIALKWGSHGDIYLLGCTNVGKSSLFNKLLLHLCGSKPGELNVDSNLLAPKATISLWPGTTLGLLSFPLISVGKRRRLLEQQMRREEEIAMEFEDYDEGDDFDRSVQKYDHEEWEKELEAMGGLDQVEVEDVLEELGLRRKKKQIAKEPPQNRYWLHDTPGAVNEAQLINYLTTDELTLGLPKAPIRPQTFILKPGQTMFLGGLARLDYLQGTISAYFTVFTWSYLSVHTTKLENADRLYERHLGQPDSIFKLPHDFEERDTPFPPLAHRNISIDGIGWKKSAADIILSSAGWVAVTVGGEESVTLRAHTPKGKGIHVRQPALFDEAVNQRGNRERYGNRTAFRGNVKKWK